MKNIRNVGAMLRYFYIFVGVKHGNPVRSGGYEWVGVMINHKFDFRFVSLKKKVEFFFSFFIKNSILKHIYCIIPSLNAMKSYTFSWPRYLATPPTISLY